MNSNSDSGIISLKLIQKITIEITTFIFYKSSLPLTKLCPKNTQKENIRKQSKNNYTRSILRKLQEKCVVESTFSELAKGV